MRTKLQIIDKIRRPSWFKGGDRYYFVLRVVDGRGKNAKIYERQVTRQCYYRFEIDEHVYSKNPAARVQSGEGEDDAI